MWRMCLTSFIIWLMINSSFVLSASISPDTYHNGHGYKIFNDGMTWQQAKSYCERLDGHLVTITSVMEQVFIEDLIRKNGAKNNYWLGGYRNGNIWSWVTGENFLYTHWASYQPDNFLGNEDALMIYNGVNPMNPVNRIGEWNDVKSDGNCNNEPFFGTSNFGFICEWDTMVDVYRGSTNIIDGIYSIQPQCAPDKELSVENNSTSWGANVIIDNINSNWKKWKVQRIANTDYYSIIAVHSNLALDVANARAENGVNISTWPYLGGSQNQFKILYAGNGYYTIQANIGGNFVVDVLNAENRAGANVWSYGFNGTPAQLWKFVPIKSLPVFQSYSKKATQKVTAYVMPDLQARSGDEYVSAGDNVTVLREEGDAIFIRYPVRGGTKERWVNKNDIFSGSMQTNVVENVITIQNPSTLSEKLQNLISSFTNPPRQKWDNRESNNLGTTCFGFANYIFRELHGVQASRKYLKDQKHILTDISKGVHCIYSGSVDDNTLHELFQRCKSGDFIQSTRNDGSGQHSMIFVSYDSNSRKVRLLDANFTTTQDNLIQDRTTTVSQFLVRFQMVSIYTK